MKIFRKITFCSCVCLVTIFLSILPKDLGAQTNNQSAKSISRDSVILAWLENLNEESVSVTGDSVKVSAETTRLLTDESYRRLMYPKNYTWESVVQFIQKQDLKKAFWFLMNLYNVNDKNKDVVVKTFLTYDKLFRMNKVLVNTFYAYVLTDPEIGSFTDGHFNVTTPHVMEKKLNTLKEILFYLDKYRPKEGAEETAAAKK
ncbi:MAG TPA: hypothetical protein VGO58_02280 [Chitinophagaceae bacterium]|jgi:hypothetical protein|nr:hypothetical protein [Chitinophagaceae bacterium]